MKKRILALLLCVVMLTSLFPAQAVWADTDAATAGVTATDPKDEDLINEDLKDEDLKDEDLKDEDLKDEDLKDEDLKDEDLKDEDLKDEDLKDEDLKDEDLKDEDLKDEDLKDEDLKNEDPKDEKPASSQQTKSSGGVTVSGVLPEGVSLSVAAGTEPGAGSGMRKAAAKRGGASAGFKAVYDISLIVENEAVQPDGTVYVTFSGAKVMKGDSVTIIHYLDDEDAIAKATEYYNGYPVEIFSTEKGNVTINANGTVSIAVGSFSTFSYTVDFHNGELTFSIPGESSVLLSTIFSALGYPYTVADVESVSFSNPELIAVEPTEDGDWLLTSLKAFHTDETLTIVFKDGRITEGDIQVLEMLVTDDDDGLGNVNYAINDSYGGTTVYALPGTTVIFSRTCQAGWWAVSPQTSTSSVKHSYKTYQVFSQSGYKTTDTPTSFPGGVTQDNDWWSDNYLRKCRIILKSNAAIGSKEYLRTAQGTSHLNNDLTITIEVAGHDYSVSFNANTTATVNNMPSNDSVSNQTAESKTFSWTKEPTRTGYTFGGWYANSGGTGTKYTTSVTLTNTVKHSRTRSDLNSSITLYAKWTPITYKVHFDPNRGEGAHGGGSMSDQSFTYDSAQNLTANAFTRYFIVTYNNNYNGGTSTANANSSFQGWATSASGSKVYNNQHNVKNLTTTNGGTVNLYAKWTNGSVTLPSLTRTGYTFLGWSESSAATSATYSSGQSYTPTADKTLYAVWTPAVYTITLDNQGATSGGTAAYFEKYSTGNYSTNACTSAISTISKPEKTNYAFGGYFTGTNGSGTKYVDADGNILSTSTTFTADTRLYAFWTSAIASITVEHYLNGQTTAFKTTSAQGTIGTSFTATQETSYQGKTLTFKSASPSETVTVASGGNTIKMYYTIPLNISVADKSVKYTGSEQSGYGKSDTAQVTIDALSADLSSIGFDYTPAKGTLVGTYSNGAITNVTKPAWYTDGTYKAGKLTITDDVEDQKVVSKTHDSSKKYYVGDTIEWTVTVTNIYNEDKTLTVTEATGMTITEPSPLPTTLAAGGQVTLKVKHVVTAADVEAGTVDNTIQVKLGDLDPREDEDDVPVDKIKITIKAASDSRSYNGDALTNDGWELSSGTLIEGNEIKSVKVTGSQTLVGQSDNVASDALIKNALDEDVTELYDISYEKGTLTVTDTDVPDNKVVTKTHDGTKEYALGDTIEWTIEVTNIYGVEKSLTIEESANMTIVGEVPSTLGPGDTFTIQATHVVTADDTTAGSITNNVKVTLGDLEKQAEDEVVLTDIGHLTITKIETSTPANGETYVLDETIAYKITVKNDGGVPITNITVTDELVGETWTIESLAVGATEEFTAEYTVTEADILAGSVKNKATATGTNTLGTEPEVDDGEVEVPTETKNGHLKVTKEVTSTPANGTAYALDETLSYKITVENDGNLTITDITVKDEKLDKSWTIDSLAPGETKEYEASYTVTQEDIQAGKIVNKATVSGTSPDPEEPDTENEDEIDTPTETKNSHLTITKTVTSTPENGECYELGETIKYKIVVENDGNQTISDITVEDELVEKTWTIDSLAPEATKEFTAEYVVTEADVAEGKVVNVATATGTDPEDDDADVDDGEIETPTETKNSHLMITKEITSTAPAEGYALGDEIEYKITVTNDGNQTISDITVTDELTADEWTISSLEPGASQEYTASYEVAEEDILAGKVKNTVTAAGKDPSGSDPTVEPGEVETDEIEDLDTTMSVEKKITDSVDEVEEYGLGDTINYSITVTNDGNATYKNIVVTDENAEFVEGTGYTLVTEGENTVAKIDELAVDAVVTITAKHVVTEEDIAAGKVVNEAVAKADDIEDANGDKQTPEGSDSVETGSEDPDEPTPPITEKKSHLTITKEVTSSPANGTAYALDETISYKITVTNDGNQTISDITVKDELTEGEWTIASLAPDESKEFETSYTVTEADIAEGSVKNVATATGTDPDDDDADVDDGETETPTDGKNSHLTIVKEITSTAPADGYALGDAIEYKITVKNDGNQTISNITVTDELTEDEWTIDSLEPGDSKEYTTSYEVAEKDILAGKVKNTVTASGKDPSGSDPTVVPGEVETDEIEELDTTMSVEKKITDTDVDEYDLGDTINYSITVTNDGNATYKNIVITDENAEFVAGTGYTLEADGENTVAKIAELAVDDVVTITAKHVVTEEDIAAGKVVNTAVAKADDIEDANGDKQTPEGSDSVETGSTDPDEPTPPIAEKKSHLTITKTVTSTPENGTAYVLNETIKYKIVVENDGNQTISNIEVKDEKTNDNWTIASLAPGETKELTAEYKVTEADISAGKVANVATASGTDPDDDDSDVDDGETETPTETKNSHLTITKTVTSTPENGTAYVLNETIKYKIVVENDGNQTISNIEVKDEKTNDNWTIASLAPGETKELTAEYKVTEADISAGKVANVATASGTDPDDDDSDVDDGETETPTETKKSHLTISKEVTSTPADGEAYGLDEEISYKITALNDGNQTITNVEVKDDLTGESWTIASLAPDESKEFTTTYKVKLEDLANGSVKNVATATGTDPDDDDADVDDGETDTPVKKIEITITAGSASKSYDGNALKKNSYELTAGELVTGDKIASVKVTGSQTLVGESANVASAAVIKNAAGEDVSELYKVTYVDGKLTVTDDNVKPSMIVTKSDYTTRTYYVGEVIEWTVWIKNIYAAEKTLKVTEIKGMNIESSVPGKLKGGQEIEIKVHHTVSQADAVAKSVTNTVTVKLGDLTAKATDTVKTGYNPYITPQRIAIEITAGSDKKVYDGTELTNNTWKQTGGKLADGDTIQSVTVTGSQTLVGESKNVARGAKIVNAAGADVTGNYAVTYINGTLKVTDGTEPDDDKIVDDAKVVTKSDNSGKTYRVGDTITWTVWVKNIYGEDKALTVTEIDGMNIEGTVPATLGAGQEITLTVTHVVTDADVQAGSVSNEVTVKLGNLEKKGEDTVNTEETPPEAPVEIPEEEVPQAAPDKSWALLNLLSMLGTVGTGLGMLITMFKKKDKGEAQPTKAKLIGTVPAAASAVTFFLTESLSAPMVLTDKWTVLMAAMLAANGATAYFTRTKKPDVDAE